MDKKIEMNIGENKFTKKEKIILDYILKNKKKACYMTSNEIADELKISASSVVRISKKLGFDTYTALRKALQIEEHNETPVAEIPYKKISRYKAFSDAELINAFRHIVVSNLQNSMSTENAKQLVRAANLITKARKVYIVGHRACSGFASSLSVMLSCIRSDIMYIGEHQPLIDRLIDIGEADCLLAISFSRYSKHTVLATEIARDSGADIIAMTDSFTSPIAVDAKAVIINDVENMSFYNSYVSFVMSMETLVALVSKRNEVLNEIRLEKMEKYLEKTGQY